MPLTGGVRKSRWSVDGVLRRWFLPSSSRGCSLHSDRASPRRPLVKHEPTYTSAESAAARGEELGVGAKTLLLRTDETLRLSVLPADRKLDSGAVKRELAVRRIRLATPQELRELTGLVPGSVPPCGEPVLPFEL